MSMNIWATEGHKVIITEETVGNGWGDGLNLEINGLELNKVYEVSYTDVGGSSSRVYLKGFEHGFNTVNFEDVNVIFDEDEYDKYCMHHPQWHCYN